MAKQVSMGRPKADVPLDVPVSTRISAETAKKLNAYIVANDRAAGWVLRKAVEEFLDRADASTARASSQKPA
jgi:hypothetical protein